jgi:hypothetical protein
MQLIIDPAGTLRYVYDETVDLRALGQVHIVRGSHVEPDDRGQWFADLSPVLGPILGPFFLRSEALVAERRWLDDYWLTSSGSPR